MKRYADLSRMEQLRVFGKNVMDCASSPDAEHIDIITDFESFDAQMLFMDGKVDDEYSVAM